MAEPLEESHCLTINLTQPEHSQHYPTDYYEETTPLIRKEYTMDISGFSTNILTQTAIAALKNAYDQCSDKAAKESIIAAFKAIIQLHHNLGKLNGIDKTSECDSDYDASEYCAAV